MRSRSCLLLSLVLALASVGVAQPDPVAQIKQDLAGWRELMEMFIMDDGHYPEASSIEALAQEIYTRQYSEQIVVADPFGRPYRANSTRNHYRISSADDSAYIENGFKLPVVKEAPITSTSAATISFPTPRSPDTTLYVTKSGNDIRLDWTGTGTQYDGAMGSDPRFSYVRTLFTDSTASNYLYTNGLLKYDETFLCFDVTDEVEVNHGGYWNGGVLPPPPPTIDAGNPSTNIGSLYDGSTGTIVGTGFSTNVADNYICFDGGVCTQATTATATQVQFITPPGAVSGDLTVQVGPRVSDPAPAFVTLEDPAVGWNIRTIGYSPLTAEYWMAGLSGINTIWRVYYNSGTKKWVKSDQKGGMAAQVLYCSGETSRAGRLFCGYGLNGAAGGTRYVDTSPVGTLTTCISLGGSGSNVNVRGAAADPNPDAVGGRDVAYFAFADTGASSYRVKKVAADCSSVLDADYGNYNWSGVWGSIVGMTVDQVTGDLYVASTTNVYKIDSSETISAVKGGFTTIYDLDLFRQSSGDPGFLLVADAGTAGAGSLKAIALDNTSASPLTVSSVSNMRAATWGGLVFGQAAPNAGNAIRKVIIHNNGNSGPVLPVRTNALIGVSPNHSSDLWISAPPPEGGSYGGPAAQYYLRPSDPNNQLFSSGRIYMWYKDGKARETKAFIGDPGKANVGYEPDPGDPAQCDKPWLRAAGNCDNQDLFVNNGVGSFLDTGELQSVKTCGSDTNKCEWRFRITKRYAGDNYKIYFQTADFASQTFFASASPVYHAVRHAHVENDRMCRNGGIIGRDAAVGATQIYLSKLYDPNTLQWNRVDTVVDDAQIAIFDVDRPFEGPHDTAFALITNPDFVDGNLHYVEVSLKVAPGGVAYDLDYSYDASEMQAADPFTWTFATGKSAGVCVQDNLYYQADPSDHRQAYDEAFVNFHIPAYGTEGAGVVPYNPLLDFDTNAGGASSFRFHQHWFSRKNVLGCDIDYDPPIPPLFCDNCCNNPQNIFHLVGLKETNPASWGITVKVSDLSCSAVATIEAACAGKVPPCTANELQNALQQNFSHEWAHQVGVNCAADAHDDNDAWCTPCGGALNPQVCLMRRNDVWPDRLDNLDRFCCFNLLGNPGHCNDPEECGNSIRFCPDPE